MMVPVQSGLRWSSSAIYYTCKMGFIDPVIGPINLKPRHIQAKRTRAGAIRRHVVGDASCVPLDPATVNMFRVTTYPC